MLNRDIKFRVWNIKYSCWVNTNDHSAAITLSGKLLIGETDWYQSLQNTNENDYIVQQYTGLKDRNNKEIYEGDIVKTYEGHVSQIGCDYVEYSCGQVIWLREGFNVCQKYIGSVPIHTYVTCNCCPCGLEIIGNIFENPELIQHESN